MFTGTVIWYDAKKGIGFIKPDQSGNDVFVHMKALKASGLRDLDAEARVTYEIAEDPQTGRPAAADISVLSKEEAELLTGGPAKIKPKKVKEKKPEAPSSDAAAFADLGLDGEIVKALGYLNYTTPTPIQTQAIPQVLDGRDLVGLAQTGTGKTAAFTLPIIQQLLLSPQDLTKRSAAALILSPTRELALQIHEALRAFGKRLPLKFVTAIGGASIRKQMKSLEKGVDILVATPGRLEDLVDQKMLRLDQTRFFVLDEADQMMDIGFLPAIRRIAKLLPKERQTLLFSATMPDDIRKLSTEYLDNPVEVSVSPKSITVERIKQSVAHLTKQKKGLALERLAKANPGKRIIAFARTKHGSDKLVRWLATQDVKADAIHGNKSQGQRQRALLDFRKGKVNLLIATDIAARGIDIPGIEIVVNYDLPQVPEVYVHRIGRTARAGADGRAITFCAPDEQKLLRSVQKLIKIDIPLEQFEGLTEAEIPPEEVPPPRGGRRGPPKSGAVKAKKPVRNDKGKPKPKGKPKGRKR